ncbi:hypothetical protein D3C72_1899620 [compost metagenome]
MDRSRLSRRPRYHTRFFSIWSSRCRSAAIIPDVRAFSAVFMRAVTAAWARIAVTGSVASPTSAATALSNSLNQRSIIASIRPSLLPKQY